jgi:hypothetical protein
MERLQACKRSAFELDLTRSKPLKRKSLSKFFHKSRSFSSFEDVMSTHHGESATALAKAPLPMLHTSWSDSLVHHRSAMALGQSAPASPASSLPGTPDELCQALQVTRLSAAAAAVAAAEDMHEELLGLDSFAAFARPIHQLGRHRTM